MGKKKDDVPAMLDSDKPSRRQVTLDEDLFWKVKELAAAFKMEANEYVNNRMRTVVNREHDALLEKRVAERKAGN